MKIINYVGTAALALVAGCASQYNSKKASLETISQNAKQRYVDACAKRSPVELSEGDKVNGLLYETLESQLVGVFEREPPASRLSVVGLDAGVVRASYESKDGRRVHCIFSYNVCGKSEKHVKAMGAFAEHIIKDSSGNVVQTYVNIPLSRLEQVASGDCFFHDGWSHAAVEKQMRADIDRLEKSIDAEMNRSLFTFPEKRSEAKPAVPDPVIPSEESDNALLKKLLPKYVGDAY